MMLTLTINQNKDKATFLRFVINLSTSYGNSRPIKNITPKPNDDEGHDCLICELR
jgi:hypothetical protein